MPSLKIEKKCELKPKIKVKNVPNPHLIYPEIKSLLESKAGMEKKDINEKKYEHSKLEGKDKVEVELEATKKVDRLSKIVYKIKIKLDMSPVNKGDIKFIGDAEVEIESKVVTEHAQDKPHQKSIFADFLRGMYEKTLYGDMKDSYMEKCTNNTSKLRDEIQAFFNLLPKMN